MNTYPTLGQAPRLGYSTSNPLDPAFWDPTNPNNLVGKLAAGAAKATGTDDLLNQFKNLNNQGGSAGKSSGVSDPLPSWTNAELVTAYAELFQWLGGHNQNPQNVGSHSWQEIQGFLKPGRKDDWDSDLSRSIYARGLNAATQQAYDAWQPHTFNTALANAGNSLAQLPNAARSSVEGWSTGEKIAAGAAAAGAVGLALVIASRLGERKENPRPRKKKAREENPYKASPRPKSTPKKAPKKKPAKKKATPKKPAKKKPSPKKKKGGKK